MILKNKCVEDLSENKLDITKDSETRLSKGTSN